MPSKMILPATILLLLASFASSAASSGMKHAATVPLPCETYSQIISPTGEQVALRCKDHTLRLVNVGSGEVQHTFAGEPQVDAYNYSHDGRWFAVGLWDGTVEVVPTSGTSGSRRWKSDSHRIETLEFFPNSNGIVVGALDRPAQLWDLRGTPNTATWQMLHEYRGLQLETFAVAFTTDGKRAVIGGPDDRITVLDPATGAEIQKFPKDADVIQQLFPFGNDGQAVILYTDGDGKKPPHQAIWNVNTAKSVPLTAERPLTGGGVVGGKLWVSSPKGNVLDIWVYE